MAGDPLLAILHVAPVLDERLDTLLAQGRKATGAAVGIGVGVVALVAVVTLAMVVGAVAGGLDAHQERLAALDGLAR